MPAFRCRTCAASFEVSPAALAKYPGWEPRYCRSCSPKKGGKRAAAVVGGTGRGGRRRAPVEENLTLVEVLARYSAGPSTGVFTDGSAVPNPGPGGWGVVWVEAGRVLAQRHGHEAHTTNNRMELRALIEAFRLLPEDAAAVVRTDSRLCVQTILEWAPKWERAGWKKRSGPIRNLEFVVELLQLWRAHPDCRLEWIAAHAGQRWNEYADSLATAWMREVL
jgi:ribonuclease HI